MAEKKKKTVAYLRVSTIDQDLEKNKADILHLANEKDLGRVHFEEEKVSGTVPWKKRKIAGILEELGQGDNILVSELSRLGRSMLECMEILSIAASKGINIYAIKGNWQLDGTLQSKILAMAFTMASEIERDLISSRTKEALRAKKASGKKLGRPEGAGKSKLDEHRMEIEALIANGTPKTLISKRYSTTRGNLYNWLSQNNLNQTSTREKKRKKGEILSFPNYNLAQVKVLLSAEDGKPLNEKHRKAIEEVERRVFKETGMQNLANEKYQVSYLIPIHYTIDRDLMERADFIHKLIKKTAIQDGKCALKVVMSREDN
jgi:DNA invertase Pin-like site-specific DNA recombinase